MQLDLREALRHFSEMDGSKKTLGEEQVVGHRQKILSYRVDTKKREMFVSTLEAPRDKVRVSSVSQQHSSDWLTVVPSTALGLHLRPQEFKSHHFILFRPTNLQSG